MDKMEKYHPPLFPLKSRIAYKELCSLYFTDDEGEPYEPTDAQCDIGLAIVTRKHKRVQVIASTQYGKSDNVAIAIILGAIWHKENYAIVSGNHKQASIIMGKLIGHLFDDEFIISQLNTEGLESVERLRQRRSADNITFRNGGSVVVWSADSRNSKNVEKSLAGLGCKNVIEDEASLIPNKLQAMITRMVGGYKDQGFIMKIGNPFYRNHFYRDWIGERYKKVFVDWKRAMREGRYTEDFIEEMRGEPLFDILYDCEFPPEDRMLDSGWVRLLDDTKIDEILTATKPVTSKDIAYLGVDVGGGNDKSVIALRQGNIIRRVFHSQDPDPLHLIPHIVKLKQEYNIDWQNVAIDVGGIGWTLGYRMHELGYHSNNILFSTSSPEPDKQSNMRSYMYYQLWGWLTKGGRIYDEIDPVTGLSIWEELKALYYSQNSDKKFAMLPKAEMKEILADITGIASSTDNCDASGLTFANPTKMMSSNIEWV